MSDRLYGMSFARIHPLYVAKVERKGRTRAELDEVIRWLTGYSEAGLAEALADGRDLSAFFAQAPALNPLREQVKGVICGVRIEAITEPLMREIRIMDRLVDELAKGRPMAKILRSAPV